MSWINHPKIRPVRAYLQIMRLDNITGTFLLLWPCLWSIAFAAGESVPVMTYVLFIIGAVIMRSAGCIVNDIVDRKIDAKVRRTRNRPLSSGDLKLYEAIMLLLLLLIIAFIILINFGSTVVMLGYIIIIPIFIYPFMKRITYWPQIFLALTFNWGALMGWAAVKDAVSIQSIMIYAACIFWTMGYDTIYACQDAEDDLMLGIKSTALKFGSRTKQYLCVFYAMTIILLWVVGIMLGSGLLFHVFLIIGAIQLIWQINTADINNSKDCMSKFYSNRYFGLIIFLGILAGLIHF